jgi:hypothetical protein
MDSVIGFLVGLIVLGVVIYLASLFFGMAMGAVGLIFGAIIMFFSWLKKGIKRVGGKRFLIWGLVVVCAAYLLVTFGYNLKQNSQKNQSEGIRSETSAYTREELWEETNKLRKVPLVLDPVLNDSAQKKCSDAVETNNLDHTGWQEYFSDKRRRIGENLAYGYFSVKEVISAWIESPSHNQNLVSPDWKYVGYGFCTSDKYGTIVVQHFSD